MPTLQKPSFGQYMSKMLHNRFQVVESAAIRGSYLLVDHNVQPIEDFVREKNGEMKWFKSKVEAEGMAELLAGKQRKVAAVKKAAPQTSAPAGAKESMAAFIRRLLSEGFTDDEIFIRAHAEKGLEEGRRSIVAWYRRKAEA
ncbi:MAG: hypothetical protein PHU06_06270 [Gallionella sp.]|nr:hypothetical protein [Gallionella sp.]MDD4958429.1 hypothetical protein [Gallionella sp.]